MSEQTEEELLQAGIGAYLVAMRNWQLAQDEIMAFLIKRVSELEAEVAKLSLVGKNELA
jgi:hypothetical protein